MKKILFLFFSFAFIALNVFAVENKIIKDEKTIELSEEEYGYVLKSKEKPLVVAISTDMAPMEFFDTDKNEYSGFVVEFFQLISEKTGLCFTYVTRGTGVETKKQVQSNEIQLVGSLSTNLSVTEALQVIPTTPFYTNTISLVSKNSWHSSKNQNDIVAVKDGYPVFENLAKSMGYENIVKFDSFEACIDAVNNKKADLTLISTAGQNVLLGHSYYANLTSIILPQTSGSYAVGVAKGKQEDILLSILNKAIISFPQEQLGQMFIKWILKVKTKLTIKDTLYENMAFILVVLLFIISVIFIYILLDSKQKRKTSLVLQENNKKLQQALIEKNVAFKSAIDANSAKTDFLSRMSHDIRTPMNGIIGLTRLAIESDNVTEIHDYLKQLLGSSNYLLGLLNDVLTMAKIEEGKMILEPEYVKSSNFIDIILPIVKGQALEKGVSFISDCSNDVPYQYFDILRVQQIVLNLLNNAIKFTPTGGAVKYIVFHKKIDGVIYCHHEISDTGIGMSPDFMKNMFNPFEQEKNGLQNNGTGLGLSICKKLTEMMGGTISVKSKLGEGTTFIVEIPTHPVTEEEYIKAKNEKSQKKLDQIKGLLNKKHVLLCEDNELNTLIATKLLEKVGIIVDTAENGKVGVEKISLSEDNFYDAVLMDIRMPVMDGLEATREIRSLKRTDAKKLPIIAMSANAFVEDIKISLEAGMNSHLSKPIEPQKMYETLAEQIEKNSSILIK